ncbi:MAG: peptidoglycan DD-metalloendopeptidase family protein [Gemmatimonadota bacterium]|nr:peptidoglycan DD-metalloendopeptidase family protein [Gemmatimonadota bacterium]MDH4351767.1 peptidoglycan DD-metalloendopeptidase family protein [Gemmatimonadota bacterium]
MRRAGAVVLVALVGSALPAGAQNPLDRQIRENQARLDSIRRERSNLEQELSQLRGRERNLATEITNLDRQKNATSRLVNELDRQIGALGTQLDSITLDLLIAQDALAEKQAVRERRIVEVYKRGPLWVFQVLLVAESFGDLLSRYKYLHLISRQDQALVTEVAVLRDRIAEERRQVATVQGLVTRNRSERERELNRFQTLERERTRNLQQTRGAAERASDRLTELERTETQINTLIANLERRRREAVAAGRATFPATITDASIGTLEWPAAGGVVYRFGRSAGPRGTVIRRDGLGIQVPVGTEVRAVAGGEIVVAGPMSTYGPTVMIDHGGGFYTLYLYLSAVSVIADQRVTGGTVIGQSGGAGTEEGPHFEFQIRQVPGNGGQPLPLDPLNWLKPVR